MSFEGVGNDEFVEVLSHRELAVSDHVITEQRQRAEFWDG